MRHIFMENIYYSIILLYIFPTINIPHLFLAFYINILFVQFPYILQVLFSLFFIRFQFAQPIGPLTQIRLRFKFRPSCTIERYFCTDSLPISGQYFSTQLDTHLFFSKIVKFSFSLYDDAHLYFELLHFHSLQNQKVLANSDTILFLLLIYEVCSKPKVSFFHQYFSSK